MNAPARTLLMTGASRGLGRKAAVQLLRDHPEQHLLLTARGGDGPRLAAELTSESGNPNVSTIACDLASLGDVRSAAAELGRRLDAAELPPLGGFLGNAGLQMTSATRTTADGFETTFGVNVLANYLLLRLLLGRFESRSRIIIVGSDVHFGDFKHNLGLIPAPRWTDVERLAAPGTGRAADSTREGRRAYATSKLAVIYLVHALARRLPPGTDVYSYNPGLVPGTGLVRDADPVSRFVARTALHLVRATPFATGPDAAGRLLARTAAGPRPGESGGYLDRGRLVVSSAESYDETREEELWTVAAKLCELPADEPAALSGGGE
ncbi:SDR family NAD(P)-dependent oxidoreductase [Amycolatopsis nigrescens]|uniref:SDR family NAD(P)-dependent oxidoreductase n=1 Tax=Amycolatopsis nigrescens TaxID=381445 RepID=UPI00037D012D|nr:SDR family NAD(P)-dependent oxidoreductase [Amycolatopsis nigrescens]